MHWIRSERNRLRWKRRRSGTVHRNLGQDIMLRFLEPYYGTGREVCTNNFFTSYNLAKILLEKSLTIFRTIRNHRREIPHSLNGVVLIHVSKQS